MGKAVVIDFEFNGVVEPKVNLVCACTLELETGKRMRWWLHNSPNTQKTLLKFLKGFDLILGYSCVAEARSILALGGNPVSWKWIDLFLEYRLITNHNDKLLYGKQLVDGKVRTVKKPKPKWERQEGEKAEGFKPTHSLAEATYKLTGKIRDTDHKTKMRDLIISNPEKFSGEEKEAIMKYCMEDVIFLPTIWDRIKEEFQELLPRPDMQEYFKEAMLRGKYSALTALQENRGYPIDVEKTRNFSRQIPMILQDCQREINALFPEIKPFRWERAKSAFAWDQKATREWISSNHEVRKWMKTDTGKISLALEAFERFYDFKHHYPTDNFGAQMVRFLKLKQSLYGFSQGGKKKNFWDSVGSDGRARPYMNHYGAQSSRSQPGASGFMFLKPAWMRALVTPKPGRFLAGIDYASQEFFISGLESGDRNMIEAYLSGDPYLYFGKKAGAIPAHGTKESHGLLRDAFKSTVLGISYLMTKYGLAVKLTNDTGRPWSEDEAQDQIDLFDDTFEVFSDWRKEIQTEYSGGGAIKLPCGWWVWGDNDNLRSVANVPIQGFGASVMRKAVEIAEKRSVNVIFTLHDAIYMEGEIGQEYKIKWLAEAMTEAFQYYFDDPKIKELAGKVRLDPFAWSPDYEKDSEIDCDGFKVPASSLYIDSRAQRDYDNFSMYFDRVEGDSL